tara:strand:- start:315 stop:554 length:240 start_codon:yes stop_codon:yes gene_type:complete
MSTHFQLIPWCEVVHAIEVLRYEELTKPTMTYKQLIEELNKLNEEQLNMEVVIYDKDCEDSIKADSHLIIKTGQVYIGI